MRPRFRRYFLADAASFARLSSGEDSRALHFARAYCSPQFRASRVYLAATVFLYLYQRSGDSFMTRSTVSEERREGNATIMKRERATGFNYRLDIAARNRPARALIADGNRPDDRTRATRMPRGEIVASFAISLSINSTTRIRLAASQSSSIANDSAWRSPVKLL